jgi:uncharacterized membrane protein
MGKKFLIYGCIGWCAEVFWTGLESLLKGDVKLSSSTYMWMFPIYGCAVLLEVLHDKIRHLPVVMRGCIYTLVIFTIEYISGMLLRQILGVCPWDYSKNPLSIHGVITLTFIPVWFCAGLIFESIHDKLTEWRLVISLN